MPPVKSAKQYTIPVETLRDRLECCQKNESKQAVGQLNIGEFPESPAGASEHLPEIQSNENFHFLKWLHRTNGSDLAVVVHAKHGHRVLKIVSLIDAHRGCILIFPA